MSRKTVNIAAVAARWSARHRRIAVAGWFVFVVIALLGGSSVGTRQLEASTSGAGESGRAQQILDEAGFQLEDASEQVLIQSERQSIESPAVRAAVTDVVRTVSRFEVVKDVRSPLEEAGQVSRDGRSALVQFRLAGGQDVADDAIDDIYAAVEGAQARHRDVLIAQSGSASARKALQETLGKDFERASLLAVPITLVILLLAFGALVAALVPLILALSAVAAAIGLLALPSQLVAMDPSTAHIILLVGLAVGVDYSLFYLRREREERAAGRPAGASLEAAAATSGRSVLVSGVTVLIAMAGMLFTGDPGFMSFGIATMLVVAIATVGSLTVLPALLSKLGDRVERGRVPARRPSPGGSRIWGAVLDRVLRRPLAAALLAVAVLVAMAVPALDLRVEASSVDAIPRDTAPVRTYDRIQAAFPGGPMPALIAVQARDSLDAPATRAAIADLKRRAIATGQMSEPVVIERSDDGRAAQISLPLAGDGTGKESQAALHTLREEIIPATLGRLDGIETAVAGTTAASVDGTQLLKDKAPIVFAFVLAFAFVLLLVAFGSLVIAAKAIVLNLLSVAAAYGLVVATFQWGWGESLLGFESTGAITNWLPLFMFVILFGLSMDYHVFILSRVRELHDGGMTTKEAVGQGIKTTAGVVTSAATVMVAVFSIFTTLGFVDMKMLGFGLAAAVLIDATLVRAVLLPASMALLGEWNWYLPRGLRRIPRLGGAEPARGHVGS